MLGLGAGNAKRGKGAFKAVSWPMRQRRVLALNRAGVRMLECWNTEMLECQDLRGDHLRAFLAKYLLPRGRLLLT